MTDHVSIAKRSQIMAAVKSKHTQPEHIVRKILHSAGYRFRLHSKMLPGTPDIVLQKYKSVINVNGCFWHGHGCHLSKKLPDTQKQFWQNKIEKNRFRDSENIQSLISQGWHVCTIWECALIRQYKLSNNELLQKIEGWFGGEQMKLEISGFANQHKNE